MKIGKDITELGKGLNKDLKIVLCMYELHYSIIMVGTLHCSFIFITLSHILLNLLITVTHVPIPVYLKGHSNMVLQLLL